ncbi:sensor histidine kinase [Azospirillum thiophilum]|uniref:sensor histidine kinase n=1 Tax=Azospirillum thiophilum TaxID=528244 RepID=UPI0009E4E695|nr:sensor histidine kinase [Azospirillum thiophilum]
MPHAISGPDRGPGPHGHARLFPWASVPILWLLLWALAGSAAWPAAAQAPGPPAAEPLRLEAATGRTSLAGHFARLVDPDHALTFADVLRADAEGRFEPQTLFRGAGQTPDVHWYRFDLLRETGAPADWILELGEAYIDHLDLHVPASLVPGPAASGGAAGYRVIRMGDFVPFSQRPMRSRLHATPLTLPEGQPVSLYLRVESVSSITLRAAVYAVPAFAGYQMTNLLFLGLFFGVLAILMVGYVALGLLLRDGALLAYTGYVASVFIFYLFSSGIGALLLPDMPGELTNLLVGGSAFLGVAAAAGMWDRILSLRVQFPILHRIYAGIRWMGILAVPTAMSPAYSITNPVVLTVASLSTVIGAALSVRLAVKNPADTSARFYAAAALAAVAGLTVTQFTVRGTLPVDLMFADPYQFAVLVSVLCLGSGLALRIRRLQVERVRAQEESAFATKRAEEQRTFVAMLSHEFRTPLASIQGAAQMIELSGEVRTPSTQSRVRRIVETTRRMSDLVELFLSADALDQGALALKPESVPLDLVMDEALEGLEGLAGTDGEPRLAVTVGTPDRPVRVDVPFLGVAVGNLVRNALRYSPPDTPVRVAAGVAPGVVSGAAGGELVIRVADQGRGMSPEEVERIGSIYFRAASSQGTKGSGLGLYMTQRIVAAHGGTLTVESAVGTGSVFTIRLPGVGGEEAGTATTGTAAGRLPAQ